MLIACWSVKGGAGTTVVATALATTLARSRPDGVLLVDLAGDVPAALGLPDPRDPGASGWLGAGSDVAADALARLELDVGPGLALLPRGCGPLGPAEAARGEVMAGLLAADHRPVVVDAGVVVGEGPAAAMATVGTPSLLVTRACYLALRRAATAPIRPSGVVLVSEKGRRLTRRDVEHVVGAPVVAEIAVDPRIAQAVDSGMLTARLPGRVERSLRDAA